MVGLMILKHRFDRSDEEVVQGLHENVVWMVFCGVPPEEAHFVESSTLCKFRKYMVRAESQEGLSSFKSLWFKNVYGFESQFRDRTHVDFPPEAGFRLPVL